MLKIPQYKAVVRQLSRGGYYGRDFRYNLQMLRS